MITKSLDGVLVPGVTKLHAYSRFMRQHFSSVDDLCRDHRSLLFVETPSIGTSPVTPSNTQSIELYYPDVASLPFRSP